MPAADELPPAGRCAPVAPPVRGWRRAALTVPAVLAATVSGLVGLTNRPLWRDEYATVYAVGASRRELTSLLANVDAWRGLYYVGLRLWVAVAGDSTVALRIPSVVGTVVAVAALTLLGVRLLGPLAGVVAGLLGALLPTTALYADFAREYAWVQAVAVLSTLALLAALDRPSGWRWVRYGALTVLVVYLHAVAGLILLAHAAFVYGRYGRRLPADAPRRRGRAFAVTVVVVLLFTAPLVYLATQQKAAADWIRNDWEAVVAFPTYLFGSLSVAALVVGGALLGCVALGRARSGLVVPLLLWALAPPAVCYAAYPAAHLFAARYSLFTLPAWALLASAAVTTGWPSTGSAPGRLRLVAASLAVLALLAVSWPAQRAVRDPARQHDPDFTAAARLVAAGYRTGDGIVYAGTPQLSRLAFRHELTGPTPRDVLVSVPLDQIHTFHAVDCPERAVARCVGQTDRIWLVVLGDERDPFAALARHYRTYLRNHYRVTSTATLRRVRVVLLLRGRV